MLPSPTLVNLHTGAHYDEYIGLGSPWGNKFRTELTRGPAIRAYEKRLRLLLKDAGWRVMLKALSGKVLGCHCVPAPCHGETIIKLFKELFCEDLILDDKD